MQEGFVEPYYDVDAMDAAFKEAGSDPARSAAGPEDQVGRPLAPPTYTSSRPLLLTVQALVDMYYRLSLEALHRDEVVTEAETPK